MKPPATLSFTPVRTHLQVLLLSQSREEMPLPKPRAPQTSGRIISWQMGGYFFTTRPDIHTQFPLLRLVTLDHLWMAPTREGKC